MLEVGLATTDDAQRTGAAAGRPRAPRRRLVNGTVVEVTVDDGPPRPWPACGPSTQEGITPATFTLREPSLDDVFLALTGRRTEDEAEETEDADGRPERRRTRRPPTEAMPIATGELVMTTAIAAADPVRAHPTPTAWPAGRVGRVGHR